MHHQTTIQIAMKKAPKMKLLHSRSPVYSGGGRSLPPPQISSICLSSAVCQQSLSQLCFLCYLFSPSFILPQSFHFTSPQHFCFFFFPLRLLSLSFCSFPFPAFLPESFPGLLFLSPLPDWSLFFLVFHSLQLTYWYFPLTFTPLLLLCHIPPPPILAPSSFPPPFFLFHRLPFLLWYS